jgi:hypothetical protein
VGNHPTSYWAIYEARHQGRLTEADQSRLVAQARSAQSGGRSVVVARRRRAGIALIRMGERLQGAQRPTAMTPT